MSRGSDTTNTDPILDSLSDSDSSTASTEVNTTVDRNDLESVNEAIENNVNVNQETTLEEMFCFDEDWNRQIRDCIDERLASRPTPHIPLYLRRSSLVPDFEPVTSTATTTTTTTTTESTVKKPGKRNFIIIPASSKVVNWKPAPKVTRTLSRLITVNDMKKALEPFQQVCPKDSTAAPATTVVQSITTPISATSEQSSTSASHKQDDTSTSIDGNSSAKSTDRDSSDDASPKSSTNSAEANTSSESHKTDESTKSTKEKTPLESNKPDEKQDLAAQIDLLESMVSKILASDQLKGCIELVKKNENLLPTVPLESLEQLELHEWSIPSTPNTNLELSAPEESLVSAAPKKGSGPCVQNECLGPCVPYERLVPYERKDCVESSGPNEQAESNKKTTCFSDSEAETVIENKSFEPHNN